MPSIITTTQVQQTIGQISKTIGEEAYIVTNHGKGKIVMLPYFNGCDEYITDYIEDYEMSKNRTVLQQRYRQSVKSGRSKLKV
jgi:hypothetical protein